LPISYIKGGFISAPNAPHIIFRIPTTDKICTFGDFYAVLKTKSRKEKTSWKKGIVNSQYLFVFEKDQFKYIFTKAISDNGTTTIELTDAYARPYPQEKQIIPPVMIRDIVESICKKSAEIN